VRKKRIVLLAVLVVLFAIFMQYGAEAGLVALAVVLAVLALLKLKNLFLSRAGLRKLESLRSEQGYEALIHKAKASESEAFSFIVVGDTRKRMKVASKVFDRISQQPASLIFHTGDIVREGTPGEYFTSLMPLVEKVAPTPVICVPGNHERGAWRDFAGFRALYGAERFAFDLGPCCFVGFNNSTRLNVSVDDLSYLDEQLSATDKPLRFVFFHEPPAFFEAAFVSDDKRRGFTKNADAMHRIFLKHHVNECFMAHIHGYASHVFDGVRYTLTAGGGARLDPRIAEQGRCHHFLVRRVGPEGVEREMVRLDGEEWRRTEG
jgi:predicted phosphodiesterase